MNHRNGRGQVRRGYRRAGFTLVEILAAMSLAVLVMLGVAQVFKISSDAVAEAESLSGGYQLGRAVMTTLDRDLRCFSNEGYLAIITADIPAALTFGGSTYAVSNSSAPTYRFDSLVFTAVGQLEEMESNTGSGTVTVGTGAEILYTFAGRVKGSGTVMPYEEIVEDDDADPRTMMLVRKAYTTKGDPTLTTYYGAYLSALKVTDATSKANGCFAMMSTDRWNDKTTAKYRLSPPAALTSYNNATNQPRITVTQTLSGGFATYDSSVNLVVCERISEFVVEALVRNPTTGVETWHRPSYRTAALWSGNLKLAATNDATLTDTYMPRLIRVTAVVHPPNDQKPLRQETYASDIPTSYPKKYHGMVFRRVFSLNGVLASSPSSAGDSGTGVGG